MALTDDPGEMPEHIRLLHYRICQERGHIPDNITLTVDPPLSVCAYCGTHYRYETRLIESNVPQVDISEGV